MAALLLITLPIFVISTIGLLVQTIRRKPTLVFKALSLGSLLVTYIVFCVLINDPRSAVLLTSLVVMAIGLIGLVVALVKRLCKKPAKRTLVIALGLLTLGIVLFTFSIGATSGFSSAFLLLSLVAGLVGIVLLLVFAVASLRAKRPAKRLGLGTAGAWCLTIVLAFTSNALWQSQMNSIFSNSEAREVQTQIEPDFEVVDGTEPLEVVEYTVWNSGLSSGPGCDINDAEHLYYVLDKTGTTEQDCLDAIAANKSIDNEFKALLQDYVHRYATTFPDASLDILCTNLQTLTFTTLSRSEYILKSMSSDSLGVYFLNENAIYVPEGTTFIEGNGEFGFQVIMHEITHAARDHWKNGSSRQSADFSHRFGADSTLLMESMNSVFSCSLLSYYEWDIAYQTSSNYLRIMLECMDNYTVTDYINHSDTYFLSKLDEASGHVNYAEVIWKLITLQRSDAQSTTIELPEEEYYPIYDFLCELWYPRHITPGMSHEEALAVADDLVYRAFYDTPDTYTITPQRFYDNLEAYLAQA